MPDTEEGWDWPQYLHPDDHERSAATWQAAVVRQDYYEIEYRIRRHDGIFRWHLGKGLPLRDLDGQVVRWFGTCTDIHDQKVQQLQLEEQFRKVQELNQYLDTFVHASAHDLRAPVANMMGLLSLLKASREHPDEGSVVGMLEASAKRLDLTLRSMIKLIEFQSLEEAAETLQTAEIMEQVLHEAEPELAKVEHHLQVELEDCPPVQFIRSYLESALRNLLSNSIKYRRKEEKLQIKVSCREEADYLVLLFEDNGIGIDLGRFGKKLFRPFSRFNREVEGKGIGLHLIQNMFARQGGKVEVESQLGQGTTFKLYIPRQVKEVEAEE